MTILAPPRGTPSRPIPATLRAFFRRHPAAFAAILALVMLVVNLVLQPDFGPVQQLAAFAPLALAAMAMGATIVGGGVDLSISPQMTLSSILLVGYLTPAGLGGYVAIPILVAVGALIGTVNGLIVIGLRLPPIVATLASMFVLMGVNLRLAPTPFILFDGWVLDLARTVWFVPGALFLVGIPLALWYLLMRSAYGRNLYAAGGNDATAYSAGINVAAVRLIAYAIGGILASIGGIALTALVSSVDATASGAYTIGAIAAVALGCLIVIGWCWVIV
jgi:ribose transport system permease protein